MIEKLSQVYEQPGPSAGGIRVPPEVNIIMLRDGSFWEGVTDTGAGPLLLPPFNIDLVATVAAAILPADEDRRGCRILNYGASPVYLSMTNPPTAGSPSEFIPPATMDSNEVIWPAQFNFDYSPTGEWFAVSAEAASLAIFTW